jgi:tetratricopeptide (TPR) repeat protein
MMKLFFGGKNRTKLFLFLFFSFAALRAEAAVDPVVVELHYQNGVKFYKRGLYEKATEEFEKTLSLDPANQEAKDYLDKLKALEGHRNIVDAKESKDAQIKSLYAEGRRLYQKHDYEEAIKVFSKILELKPVDDFASFYRERSEIAISRKLAREKKIEDKKKLKELRIKRQLDIREEKERKKQERLEMLKKRKEIKEGQLNKPPEKQEEARQVEMNQALTQQEKERLTPQELKKEKIEEKKKAAEERAVRKREERQQRLEEKKAKIEEKKKAAQEKRDAIRAERQEKLKEKEDRRVAAREAKEKARQAKVARVESKKVEKKESLEKKKQAQEERRNNKELFLKGVESYSRKQYQEAIDIFKELIDTESKEERIYTTSAQRLMEKARLRLKGIGEDVTIENK